ncbi:MAG: hypothetical protein FWG93_05620 [Oscillospiraceae bacterium]|nr:hypothetical protein [Oscillospiraceae bacterium]
MDSGQANGSAAAGLRALPFVYAELRSRAVAGTSGAVSAPEALREPAKTLRNAGVPAFTQLAEKLDRFLDEGTPEALLDAAALASMLMRPARLDQTGGEPVKPADAPAARRQLSYRRLTEARDALAGRGADRIKILEAYFEDGGWDARLVPWLADASGDRAVCLVLSKCREALEWLERAALAEDCRAALQALGSSPHPEAGDALLRLALRFRDGKPARPRALGVAADELGRRGDTAPECFDFLAETLERLGRGEFGEEHALGLEIALTQALASRNTTEALHVLERFLPRARMPAIIAELALRLRSPEDFYERYGGGRPVDPAPIRGLLFNRLAEDQHLPLDKRWSALFRERGDWLMAALTARPDDAGTERYLQEMLERLSVTCPNS